MGDTLKVVPVIDILNGAVVHAVKGRRSEYKPLESVLTKSTDPIGVAEAFKTLGFSELYIADLDAIIDCRDDFAQIRQISEKTGFSLLVDAGVTGIERAHKLMKTGVVKLIIGTETLKSKAFVAEALQHFGSDHVVVSLDLKEGKVLAQPSFIGPTEPMQLLREFKNMGVRQVIVLDLSRVGSGEGVDIEFLKEAIAKTGLEVYVGGGVRDITDLIELREIGVSGALIATSLHTGEIVIADLKREGFV
jgi:phosphoribosylformimino-5-aminoimidazole carboxamide ribotide isomerase